MARGCARVNPDEIASRSSVDQERLSAVTRLWIEIALLITGIVGIGVVGALILKAVVR
jgi:hypothetical protein